MTGSDQVKVEFAERFNALLLEQGIKNAERFVAAYNAAYKESLSSKAITKWRKGETLPETKRLPLLCDMFGVKLEWLVCGTGPKFQHETYDVNDKPGRAYSGAELDRALLEALIDEADRVIRRRHLQITPKSKAAAIAGAYQISIENGMTAKTYNHDLLSAALVAAIDQSALQS